MEILKKKGDTSIDCLSDALLNLCKEIDAFSMLADDTDRLFSAFISSRRGFTAGIVFRKLDTKEKFRSIPTYLKLLGSSVDDLCNGFKRPVVDVVSLADRIRRLCAFFDEINELLESVACGSPASEELFRSVGVKLGACTKRLQL